MRTTTRTLKSKKFEQFNFERDLVNQMLRENLSVSERQPTTAEEICVPITPHVLSDVEVKIYWQVLAEQVYELLKNDQKENERWIPRIQETWALVKNYPVPAKATYPSVLGRLVPSVDAENWCTKLATLVMDTVAIKNATSADISKTN